jgi:phosphate transport system permease protein
MDNPIENRGFVFSQESLRKKFRLSEFLSEKIITGVAFLSIAIIVMIFFFVFKESFPIFQSRKKEIAKVETVQKQEQYGVDTNVAMNASGQKSTALSQPRESTPRDRSNTV